MSLADGQDSARLVAELGMIQGLLEHSGRLGLGVSEPDAMRVAAGEFMLEGLYAHRRISRDEERRFAAEAPQPEGRGKRPRRPGGFREPSNLN